MSFGQQSGPPASQKQVATLLSLLEASGYDFATGRHRYSLTQRQARGRFSVSEAAELIERLTAEAESQVESEAESEAGPAGAPTSSADHAARTRGTRIGNDRPVSLKGIPAEVLANELESRGWVIIPPS